MMIILYDTDSICVEARFGSLCVAFSDGVRCYKAVGFHLFTWSHVQGSTICGYINDVVTRSVMTVKVQLGILHEVAGFLLSQL